MNDETRVLFRYMVTPDLSGLFVTDGNLTRLVVAETAVSSTGGFTLVSESASLNNHAQVAFTAQRRSNEGEGLFTGPYPATDKVIAPGDVLFGRTVLSVHASKRALNDNGQIAFWADFTDGSQAILRADPVLAVAPSNKEECKHGGRALFHFPRTFKNQGDCVQFIETGK